MLSKDHEYSLMDIISNIKKLALRDDNFCLYGEADEQLKADGKYYVADYPDVDDNDNEIYPEIVRYKRLYYLYSGEQFTDVIDTVIDQKPLASIDDFVVALNYYSVNDDFLDF